MTDQPAKSTFKIALEAAEAMEAENASLKQRLNRAESRALAAELRAEDAEDLAARAEDGAHQMAAEQFDDVREALEAERDKALARTLAAEAQVQAVLNALGVGIRADGKPHYSSSAADDAIVKAWPALSGEFLAKEELEHRREIISALDTFAPKGVTIEEIINDAWGWGRAMSVARAQAILDRLILMYPGLIVEAQVGDYRATVPIAARDESGEISNDIAVVTTDWDALLDATFAKLKAGEIKAMPEPGTEAKPRRRRKPTAIPAPAPENPNAGVAAMMEAAERVMKAASAPKPVAVPAEGNANDAAIIKALERGAKEQPGTFLKVADLYKLAKGEGYTNGEPALRFRMKLAANPLAKQRADIIEEQTTPVLAWKLRTPSPDGGDKIDQPEAPTTVAPEPAPAEPESLKLYGRLSPADRLKRDRLLLEALGDEGKTFREWSREITARGGDMGPNPQLWLEAAQQRMKVGSTGEGGPSRHGLSIRDGYITRNHFGGGATFYAHPSLKEALAKLEASK